jgi:hypothetical protein
VARRSTADVLQSCLLADDIPGDYLEATVSRIYSNNYDQFSAFNVCSFDLVLPLPMVFIKLRRSGRLGRFFLGRSRWSLRPAIN